MRNDFHQERLNAVRSQLAVWDVDAVYISSATNCAWLSGFTGSNGQLLISSKYALLSTDFRYWIQAAQQAPAYTLFKSKRTPENTAELFTSIKAQKVGIEAKHLTVEAANELRSNEALSEITWVELSQTVEQLRAVKNDEEIKAIQAAAAITDYTMAQVPKLARPGITEKELAWELEKVMRGAGAESTAFPIIVAAGPNSALPHHHPGDRILTAGDVLVVDMGAQLNGYKSDLTRSFYLGQEPPEQFWHVYNAVQGGQTAVFQNARTGMNAAEVDALAREFIASAGYGEAFGHGLGHGVGLDIHEEPFLSSKGHDSILLPFMTTTVEPGIYLPGWGGIRIEDLAVFTEEGLAPISHCPKEPLIPLPE